MMAVMVGMMASLLNQHLTCAAAAPTLGPDHHLQRSEHALAAAQDPISSAARALAERALPKCGSTEGPGSITVSTAPTPATDSYYVAVFATLADAAPADGAAPRLLTLTRTKTASAVVSGLTPGKQYWFRWRSHNDSYPTLARGWRDYGQSFACTTGLAADLLSAPSAAFGAADKPGGDSGGTKFMWVYRVSEYTDDVDFLTNHNSASEAGQAGFLTNTDSSLFFSFNNTAVCLSVCSLSLCLSAPLCRSLCAPLPPTEAVCRPGAPVARYDAVVRAELARGPPI